MPTLSQARMQTQLPLLFPKGCGQLRFTQCKNWKGRKVRGTQKVGGPDDTSPK